MNLHDLVSDKSKLKTAKTHISADEAFARMMGGDASPLLMKIITKDPHCAYRYAIINGRWPEGEKAIATHPEYAYQYATNIIKGRWPEGEKAIATDPVAAYRYAKYVIKGRFPEGEKAIAQNPYFASEYDRFLNGLEK